MEIAWVCHMRGQNTRRQYSNKEHGWLNAITMCHECHPIGLCKQQDTSLINTTKFPWRLKEVIEIYAVKGKGSSRRRKEVEKSNRNDKWGGLCCVELFCFS